MDPGSILDSASRWYLYRSIAIISASCECVCVVQSKCYSGESVCVGVWGCVVPGASGVAPGNASVCGRHTHEDRCGVHVL